MEPETFPSCVCTRPSVYVCVSWPDATMIFTLRFPPPDWVEFSPYEIGMAKYGTFMTPDLFGSKFFMGTAVKKYEENPLHFLMGEKLSSSCGDVCTWG